MSHVILLGDSIFDNSRYVPGRPEVVEQLRERLPQGWRATLLAVDGAVADDVRAQLKRLPADASHLVVSAGGNDALGYSGILDDTHRSVVEAFADLGAAQQTFRQHYRDMLAAVLGRRLPTVVCTVYDAVPGMTPDRLAGLSVFNDVIVHEAARAGVPVIDLRLVCPEASDYSATSPIEPSASGGAKIARAIGRALADPAFADGCRVYT